MKNRNIIFCLLVIVCLSLAQLVTHAQSYDRPVFSAVQTTDGIEVYRVTGEGANFVTLFSGIYGKEFSAPENSWIVEDHNDMSSSFDGRHIAFGATQNQTSALFIYDILSDSLLTVPTPELVLPIWSPDSNYILLIPAYRSDYKYLYDFSTQTITTLSDQLGYRWLSDSSGFTFLGSTEECLATFCDVARLYITDRLTLNMRPLTNLLEELGTDITVMICNSFWSNPNRRLYYVVGCSGYSDTFPAYIYSTDLEGNNRLEIDFQEYFPDENYIKIHGVYPQIDNDNIYIVMDSYYSSYSSRLLKLTSPDMLEILYEISIERASISDSALSSDFGHVAFSNQISSREGNAYVYTGQIRVFDLQSETLTHQINFDGVNACNLEWLDEKNLLYTIVSNQPCEQAHDDIAIITQIYNLETQTTITLPENPIGMSWIIRSTYVVAPIALNITESDGSTTITESGTPDTYTLALGTQPTADVVVSMAGTDQITVSPSSLTFTPENWDMPQTITVSAVDDSVVEGIHTAVITHSAVSADAGYNGISVADVMVSIGDDE